MLLAASRAQPELRVLNPLAASSPTPCSSGTAERSLFDSRREGEVRAVERSCPLGPAGHCVAEADARSEGGLPLAWGLWRGVGPRAGFLEVSVSMVT